MAVYSMTGYANASVGAACEADGAAVASGGVIAELRSVNGRFLDVSFRLPDELRALEPGLRDLLSSALRRGKVELRVSSQRDADLGSLQPTPDQLMRLAQLESTIQSWLPNARPLSIHEAIQWCRSIAPVQKQDDLAMEAIKQCIEGLREARAREGGKLVAMLMERVRRLRELALQTAPLVPTAVQRQQERFVERWNEALQAAAARQSVPAEALQERALSEAAAYAIRIDVAEELSRLSSHLDEVERLLKAGGEIGKRLDFLIQELHREANTLGSKAAAVEITAISVEMKVAIEQMREQVQNIE